MGNLKMVEWTCVIHRNIYITKMSKIDKLLTILFVRKTGRWKKSVLGSGFSNRTCKDRNLDKYAESDRHSSRVYFVRRTEPKTARSVSVGASRRDLRILKRDKRKSWKGSGGTRRGKKKKSGLGAITYGFERSSSSWQEMPSTATNRNGALKRGYQR